MSFIFGGDTGITYEQLKQRRKMAERLRKSNARTPRNAGEGIHAIARALVARGVDRQNTERSAELQKQYSGLWDGLLGTMSGSGGGYASGGTYTPPEPDPAAGLDMGRTPEQADAAQNPSVTVGDKTYDMGRDVEPDMKALLIESANELGMDPVDLATYISYETGGTFDPLQKGPTTKWGQHKGFIQFGEPQAKQYGVDWNNPVASQLGRDGAVVRYFKENGWKPGMSFMDGYSIINAGGPGRYNASDTAAGGAPGTVADKVNNQMGGHRQKAAQFLGGSWTPSPPQQSGGVRTAQAGGFDPSIMQLAQMLSVPDEFMPPGQKAVAQALLSQKLTQSANANDPMRALQMQKLQMELANANKMTPYQQAQIDLARDELEFDKSGAGDGTEYGLTPQYVTDADGNLQLLQLSKNGTPKLVDLPEGVALQKGVQKLDLGTAFQWFNNVTGEKIGDPIPKDLRGASRETAIGKGEGENQIETEAAKPRIIDQANSQISLIDSVLNDPALSQVVGKYQGRLNPEGFGGLVMSQEALNLMPKIKQIGGKEFLQAFESLKGGGQITEREGQAALDAATRLQRYQDDDSFKAALTELRDIAMRAKLRAQGVDVPEFGDVEGYADKNDGAQEGKPKAKTGPGPYKNMSLDELVANPPSTEEEAAAWNRRFEEVSQ